VDENTKIIYLANPNNPTGNLYSPAAVLKLAQDNPQALVLSDEAYFEYAGVSCAKLIEEVDNVVITRSFSKCFSLAGLRIGYLIAPELVIGNLRRLYNPKSVNMLAQIAAVATLDDVGYYKKYIREVKRSAALFKRFFDQRGIPCRPTYANFILVQFENPKEMARKLAKAGVHVRDRSKHLPNVLRFGLGNEEQTVEILSRLEEILDN
jgi:histidinol-phosphate aminotransferase